MNFHGTGEWDAYHRNSHDCEEKCPAFSEGKCPFKDAQSETELQEKMKQIPSSHHEQPLFRNTMEHIHQMNKKYTELLGKSCPHFQQSNNFRFCRF